LIGELHDSDAHFNHDGRRRLWIWRVDERTILTSPIPPAAAAKLATQKAGSCLLAANKATLPGCLTR
jgi:hypothetical protein